MALPVSDLRSLRCRRHGDREAVAKCGTCDAFFCRECILEHEGRMICAGCLAELAKAADTPQQRVLGKRIFQAVLLLAAFMANWAFFILLAKLLIWFKGGAQWLETL